MAEPLCVDDQERSFSLKSWHLSQELQDKLVPPCGCLRDKVFQPMGTARTEVLRRKCLQNVNRDGEVDG